MDFFLMKWHVAKISMVLLGETFIILIFIFVNMQIYIYNKNASSCIGCLKQCITKQYTFTTLGTGVAAIVQNS
jgi:hypothetical protein